MLTEDQPLDIKEKEERFKYQIINGCYVDDPDYGLRSIQIKEAWNYFEYNNGPVFEENYELKNLTVLIKNVILELNSQQEEMLWLLCKLVHQSKTIISDTMKSNFVINFKKLLTDDQIALIGGDSNMNFEYSDLGLSNFISYINSKEYLNLIIYKKLKHGVATINNNIKLNINNYIIEPVELVLKGPNAG